MSFNKIQEQLSPDEAQDVLGLPGLKSIREMLGVRQDELAPQVGRTPQWLSQIENGKDDCTQALQRKLAKQLCCKVVDLLEEPSPDRLKTIEILYRRRQLQQLEADEKAGAA